MMTYAQQIEWLQAIADRHNETWDGFWVGNIRSDAINTLWKRDLIEWHQAPEYVCLTELGQETLLAASVKTKGETR